MNEDDIPPPRFAGRTYSCVRQNTASRVFDELVGSKAVPVKSSVPVSKWGGGANYASARDSSDGTAEPKKAKMESKVEDPFSFDTDDKRKLSPVKKQQAVMHEQEPHRSTRLPASRIVVKGEEYMSVQKEEATQSQTFHTHSQTSKKNSIKDQSVDMSNRKVPEETSLFSVARLIPESSKDEEEDDIFPVKFRKDPIKTYSGKVDKPESPSAKKYGYSKKDGQGGRRPLTKPDPDLIEAFKRNHSSQQLKPGTHTKELNNGMVVSRQELDSNNQGTTTAVCKPGAQQEKSEMLIKYLGKNPKSKESLAPVALDKTASKEKVPGTNGNNNNISTKIDHNCAEIVPLRTSARLRNVSAAMAVSGDSSSSRNEGSFLLNCQNSAKNPRSKNAQSLSAELPSFQSSVSSNNSFQGNKSSGQSGKRYRIFKSRAPQEDHKPHVVTSDKESNDLSSQGSKSDLNSSGDALESLMYSSKSVFMRKNVQTKEEVQHSQKSLEESQTSDFSEASSVAEPELDDINVKQIDPAVARGLLAARLRNLEKGNDSDSTGEPDVMDCSDLLPSQESVSSSQNTSEEGSQKECVSSAPRKFFKSKKSLSGSSDLQKRLFGNSPQKTPAKAIYNARSWYSEHEIDGDKEEETSKILTKENDNIVIVTKDSHKRLKLKREVHWPERQFDEAYTSLKVNKNHRELYTVVHNVKQTHEVQELGETQDFIDEVDYLLDSLRSANSTTIRCLSCLKLAGKCISPAFRMHLRAHGTVTKIFTLLHDACSDPSLALSTSAVMFMLSRDRLNMDLDRESLNLMLKLNEVDAGEKSSLESSNLRELEKTRQKVMELLAQLQQETHAREIDLGFVSTGNLAMESLLSLTSRRAGEWFKEELRSVGGLDHVVDSVKVCETNLPEDLSQDIQRALPVLRKLDRCLRVLENISFMNSDNQNYLILYKNAVLLQACTRTLQLCQQCMPVYKLLENHYESKALKELPGYTILTCMLAILRVMLNITHENQLGNLDITVETSLMQSIVRCLTATLWCIPSDQRFDLAVLCLGLLINLVEHRQANRKVMMSMDTQVKYTERAQPRTTSAIKAVVELFVQREEAAREMEENAEGGLEESSVQSHDQSGEWEETDSGIQWITNNLKKAKEVQEKQKKSTKEESEENGEGNQSILEDDEETFTKALHKAGKHMENSIVASYAGLLLGSTIMGNKEYASYVKKLVPNEDFGPMIRMLKKFLNFMSLTTAFGSTDVNGITKVIEVLESA